MDKPTFPYEPPPTGDHLGYLQQEGSLSGRLQVLELPQRIVDIAASCHVYIGANGLVVAPSDTEQPLLKFDHMVTMKIVDAIARFAAEPDNPALFNFIKQLNANRKDTTK